MKKYYSAALALMLSGTCITASAATQEISKIAYVCDENKIMEVVYINTTAGNSYAVINQMDEMIPMQLMKMASGANYEAINKNYSYKLYTKGKNADLVDGNDKPVFRNCSVAE
ncbi:TPA: c-type lysozyme inhibitor [Escherichia coli]|nr:c-type lysozyme inhibitor [Escherichia coli]EIG0481222.1 c-type lysozyme inhibitor [Escherichia coli]HBQ4215335.1 c-type lysozyme inhibitor [Escherichia coli]HDW3209744.1 c-type lysozyme inhibitor [Escherichia coli]HEB5728628.1 c-type lysozyme inhibitor [Escherichia coli]